MLEELKKHRLEEKLSPLIKKEENIKKELLTEDELKKIEEEKRTIEELRKRIRNNFFKLIFQKRKYNELVKKLRRIDIIETKQKNLKEILRYLKKEKEDLQKAYDSINSIEDLLKEREIGFGFTELNYKLSELFQKCCQFLRNYCNENKIEFLLDQEEWESFNNELNKSLSIEDNSEKVKNDGIEYMSPYVLVHKTDYIPSDGRIKTSKESGVESESIVLDRIGSTQFKSARNTVHFAVNGEVGSHARGNWDNKKYAVLIPFKDIPVNQLRCAYTVDTFIEGGLKLPKTAYFLCPEEEIEVVKRNNPDINVIGYKGKKVSGYANLLVSMLGYKMETCGMWSWVNDKDQREFEKNLLESGLNVEQVAHSYTKEKFEEDYFNNVNLLMAFLKKIVAEKIELTELEIDELSNRFSRSLARGFFEKEDYLKYNKVFCGYLVSFFESCGINITDQINNYVNEISNLSDDNYKEADINKQFFNFIFNNINEYIKDNNVSRKI